MGRFTLFLCIFLFAIDLAAQPPNDACDNAFVIADPNFWCSEPGTFTTRGATKDPISTPVCFSGSGGDVWFSFVARATDVNFSIRSATIPLSSALYTGDCATLQLLSCEHIMSVGTLQLYNAQLVPGRTYLLRIQAIGVMQGDFNICMNNYFPPALPGADCSTAFILCSKDAFTIDRIQGRGMVAEMDDGSCFLNQGPVESNSVWLKFTCKDPGTLTMIIQPVNPTDDIDFIIYRLTKGLNSCDKTVVRCMATGEFTSQCLDNGRCCGPTGLRHGETDVNEPSGCDDPLQNNFLAPLDMQSGESYAIAINNYSSSNKAVIVELGGTATLLGVQPAFDIIQDTTPLCLDSKITLVNTTDTSIYKIDQWKYFVTPDSADWSTGNEQVSFLVSGRKYIDMVVRDKNGCIVTVRDSIDIQCCGPRIFARADDSPLLVQGQSYSPSYTIATESEDRTFNWSPAAYIDCATCPEPVITAPDQTTEFYLRVTDAKGCTAEDTFIVNVSGDKHIFVPNVFTPDHDGVNDHFAPEPGPDVAQIERFAVYDRWGSCVYSSGQTTQGRQPGWNGYYRGRKANQGTYAWVMTVRFTDGEVRVLKGAVTLL